MKTVYRINKNIYQKKTNSSWFKKSWLKSTNTLLCRFFYWNRFDCVIFFLANLARFHFFRTIFYSVDTIFILPFFLCSVFCTIWIFCYGILRCVGFVTRFGVIISRRFFTCVCICFFALIFNRFNIFRLVFGRFLSRFGCSIFTFVLRICFVSFCIFCIWSTLFWTTPCYKKKNKTIIST